MKKDFSVSFVTIKIDYSYQIRRLNYLYLIRVLMFSKIIIIENIKILNNYK